MSAALAVDAAHRPNSSDDTTRFLIIMISSSNEYGGRSRG
jgi:hypothetical protein